MLLSWPEKEQIPLCCFLNRISLLCSLELWLRYNESEDKEKPTDHLTSCEDLIKFLPQAFFKLRIRTEFCMKVMHSKERTLNHCFHRLFWTILDYKTKHRSVEKLFICTGGKSSHVLSVYLSHQLLNWDLKRSDSTAEPRRRQPDWATDTTSYDQK